MEQQNQHDMDERNSELSMALEGLNFPADKSNIVSYARSHELDSDILSVISNLPERQYQDLRDVLDHFAGGTDRTETDQDSSSAPPH